MKLHLTAQSERGKPVTKSGNEFIQLLVCDENRNNIAQVNFFYKEETGEILTTFVPLNCQRYTKQGNGKALAQETKTERYCTGMSSSKPKTAREVCQKHGSEYMERHKLDGHYICRACVIESLN